MKDEDWYIINNLLLALVSISLLIIVFSMPFSTSYTPAPAHNKEDIKSGVGELFSIEFSEDGMRMYVTENDSISVYTLKKSYDVRTAEFNKSIKYQSESFSTPENETWGNITPPTISPDAGKYDLWKLFEGHYIEDLRIEVKEDES